MKNNTIFPAAIFLLLMHACSGCGTVLHVTRDGGKIDIELKTAARPSDPKSVAATVAALTN